MPSSAPTNDELLLNGVNDALRRAGIAPGDTLLIAWSGGRDSTVLIDLLQRLAPTLGVALVAAHIDHGMRPSSGNDARHCEDQARRRGLRFERVTLKAGTLESQADARQARYSALATIARAHQARALLTAHHGDDRLESALINLVRGTGLDGLATLRDDTTLTVDKRPLRLLRPLAFASATMIATYAEAHALAWVDDPTNATESYLRNRLRQRVTPALRAIAGDLAPARRTLSNLISEREAAEHAARELLERARRPALEADAYALDARTLLNAPRATCARALLSIAPHFDRATLDRIASLLPEAFSITPKHLAAPAFLVRASHGQLLLLPSTARGGRDRLTTDAPSLTIPSTHSGALTWPHAQVRWSTLPAADAAPDHPSRPWRLLLSPAHPQHPLILRGARPGDILLDRRADGSERSTKASTIFQAARLGTDVRRCWPCIANADGNLIWIAGITPPHNLPREELAGERLELIVRPSAALSAILQWERK